MATRELIIDSFAGGGGASLGIGWALDRSPDVAINHNPGAIAMHTANHPDTKHLTEDVFRVNPRKATGGRPVGLMWASPDCRHFSRAKGGKPVQKSIRGLAWVVIKWAAEVSPRVIILENVREFQDWGPLCPRWDCSACNWRGTEGQAKLARGGRRACPQCDSAAVRATEHQVPNPDKKGVTFRQFCGRLRGLGYHVETQVLNAADYGAPTHRRRLFLIARRDKAPIVWPEPTHGAPEKVGRDLLTLDQQPWRTAAQCIDWSVRCPSIFDRKKPLAEKTLKRIAMGVKRYVLDAGRPFLVPLTHAGERRGHPDTEPVPTVTGANRGEFGLVAPIVANLAHGDAKDGRDRGLRANQPDQPLGTVHAGGGSFALVAPVVARIGQTGGNGAYSNSANEPVTTVTSKAEHVLVSPVLIGCGGPSRTGEPRDLEQPLNTVMPKDARCVVAPVLMPHYGKSVSADVGAPLPTVTAGGQGKQVLIAPTLVQTGYGEREGQAPRVLDLNAPLGTVVGSPKHALVAAFVAKHFGGVVGVPADTPLPTTTARGTQNQLVAANLVHMNHGDKQWNAPDEPLRTVTTGGHAALVYSFLVKYFGTAIGCEVSVPSPTVTAKDRFGLVTVAIDGEPYVIVDIGMRMLKPRELARAQGFPDSYQLTGTNTNQVERIGNSVCPHVAAALVRANCSDMAAVARTAA